MSHYHIVTTWRVPGTVEEAARILADVEELPLWWPEVYLGVQVLAPGDATGLGFAAALLTRGWLPYLLRWQLRVTEVSDRGLVLEADGDLRGRGEWHFAQEGPTAVIGYDWRVEARKPMLRAFGPALAPLFAWNHRWAMARGEEGLRREMARRRTPGIVGVRPPVSSLLRAPASP